MCICFCDAQPCFAERVLDCMRACMYVSIFVFVSTLYIVHVLCMCVCVCMCVHVHVCVCVQGVCVRCGVK
jgi:hypothetical protein